MNARLFVGEKWWFFLVPNGTELIPCDRARLPLDICAAALWHLAGIYPTQQINFWKWLTCWFMTFSLFRVIIPWHHRVLVSDSGYLNHVYPQWSTVSIYSINTEPTWALLWLRSVRLVRFSVVFHLRVTRVGAHFYSDLSFSFKGNWSSSDLHPRGHKSRFLLSILRTPRDVNPLCFTHINLITD